MESYELVEQGRPSQSELIEFNPDNILQLAAKADLMVAAMKKIMTAALAVTTEKDWCLIGGTPYLQESGATKVGRLYGVSWRTNDPTIEIDDAGYRTFIFKGSFSMGNASIEAEGSRSMKDDFFSKKGGALKSPDEIDMRDVRLAAYTSCINNGVKRLVPGLRNITIETLENAGLDVSKIRGYTFKDGSKGGATKTPDASGIVCSECGSDVSQRVASFSQSKYDAILCMNCQDKRKAAQQ